MADQTRTSAFRSVAYCGRVSRAYQALPEVAASMADPVTAQDWRVGVNPDLYQDIRFIVQGEDALTHFKIGIYRWVQELTREGVVTATAGWILESVTGDITAQSTPIVVPADGDLLHIRIFDLTVNKSARIFWKGVNRSS